MVSELPYTCMVRVGEGHTVDDHVESNGHSRTTKEVD